MKKIIALAVLTIVSQISFAKQCEVHHYSLNMPTGFSIQDSGSWGSIDTQVVKTSSTSFDVYQKPDYAGCGDRTIMVRVGNGTDADDWAHLAFVDSETYGVNVWQNISHGISLQEIDASKKPNYTMIFNRS